jgi:hypothetical protein
MIDLDVLLVSASATIAAWTPKVLGALLVFGVGLLIARWARAMTQGALSRSKVIRCCPPSYRAWSTSA